MSRSIPASINAEQAAALAASRFGLGEPTLQAVGGDDTGWLLSQLGPAEAQRGQDLASGVEAVKRYAKFLRLQRAGAAAVQARAAGSDTDQSAGPQSAIVQRLACRAPGDGERPPRISGLNENLAREVLELHTLGVANGGAAYGGWGGYTQADVTALARVLTGWRVPQAGQAAQAANIFDGANNYASRFGPAWHEPGSKTVFGRNYPAGLEALNAVLADLARYPSTARFLSLKIDRHFVADQPPPAQVERLETAHLHNGGQLLALYRASIDPPAAWSVQPVQLETPEKFVISTVRRLGLGAQALERPAGHDVPQ